jgi:spore germination cell wall hydrolase CwlJ-like protein
MNTIIVTIAAYLAIFPNAHINRQDINCMARAVYHEARGEPIEGQSAVAHVILNRVRSPQYPNTICKVVYQPHQFTGLFPNMLPKDQAAWRKAIEISIMVRQGDIEDNTHGAMWYYAPSKVKTPAWALKLEKSATVNNHSFYKLASK